MQDNCWITLVLADYCLRHHQQLTVPIDVWSSTQYLINSRMFRLHWVSVLKCLHFVFFICWAMKINMVLCNASSSRCSPSFDMLLMYYYCQIWTSQTIKYWHQPTIPILIHHKMWWLRFLNAGLTFVFILKPCIFKVLSRPHRSPPIMYVIFAEHWKWNDNVLRKCLSALYIQLIVSVLFVMCIQVQLNLLLFLHQLAEESRVKAFEEKSATIKVRHVKAVAKVFSLHIVYTKVSVHLEKRQTSGQKTCLWIIVGHASCFLIRKQCIVNVPFILCFWCLSVHFLADEKSLVA